MAIRLELILLLSAMILAMVVEASPSLLEAHWAVGRLSGGDGGLVGDSIDMNEEMMMESESARRSLAGRNYISYGAMQKNNVPCNRRGQSYYNCNSRGKANPYSRGCNTITRCGRRR